MPTPLAYGEYLYVCANHGVLTAWNAKTGERVWQNRLADKGGAFSASPADMPLPSGVPLATSVAAPTSSIQPASPACSGNLLIEAGGTITIKGADVVIQGNTVKIN